MECEFINLVAPSLEGQYVTSSLPGLHDNISRLQRTPYHVSEIGIPVTVSALVKREVGDTMDLTSAVKEDRVVYLVDLVNIQRQTRVAPVVTWSGFICKSRSVEPQKRFEPVQHRLHRLLQVQNKNSIICRISVNHVQ